MEHAAGGGLKGGTLLGGEAQHRGEQHYFLALGAAHRTPLQLPQSAHPQPTASSQLLLGEARHSAVLPEQVRKGCLGPCCGHRRASSQPSARVSEREHARTLALFALSIAQVRCACEVTIPEPSPFISAGDSAGDSAGSAWCLRLASGKLALGRCLPPTESMPGGTMMVKRNVLFRLLVGIGFTAVLTGCQDVSIMTEDTGPPTVLITVHAPPITSTTLSRA